MRFTCFAVLALLPACSFIFTNSAPDTPITASTTLTCTTSNAAPAIDTALAALQGVGTAVYASKYSGTEDASLVIGAGVAWTAVFAVAAGYGFSVTNSCTEAIAKRDEAVAQRDRMQEEQMVRLQQQQQWQQQQQQWQQWQWQQQQLQQQQQQQAPIAPAPAAPPPGWQPASTAPPMPIQPQ